MLKREYLLLVLIIIVASILRFWNLSHNPNGFFVDEASAGYNAYKILTTGKDAHDKWFPVIFEAVGDYRDPVMIYSTVPFIWLFGLTEYGVRVTSVVYGIAGVLMMYLVGKKYFNNSVGIWAAALLAISPWQVHFSRVGFQLISAVFWILFGLYFLRKSKKNITYYFVSVLGFILAFFSYSTTKMYILPLLIFFAITHRKLVAKLTKDNWFWVINLLAISGVCVLIYPYVEDGTFFKRWAQVQYSMSLLEIGKAYLNHFSPDFLFIKGDAGFFGQDVKRHSIHGVGELYYFQIVFLIISIIAFFSNSELRKKLWYWILFLLIYPLGSIFTSINPQASRSILGVIPFTILTAIGIDISTNWMKTKILKRTLYFGTIWAMVTSVILFVVALYNYPLTSSNYWGWQYGFKETILYFKQQEKRYDDLIITHRFNMGHELLNFYNVELLCDTCTTMNNPIKIDTERKQLFALRQDDIDEARKLYPSLVFNRQHEIFLPDGEVELVIGTFNSHDDKLISLDGRIQ